MTELDRLLAAGVELRPSGAELLARRRDGRPLAADERERIRRHRAELLAALAAEAASVAVDDAEERVAIVGEGAWPDGSGPDEPLRMERRALAERAGCAWLAGRLVELGWRVADGEVVTLRHGTGNRLVAIAPDGTRLVMVEGVGFIRLPDAPSGA